MTDGHFYYTAEGKVMKVFGPDNNDGLSLLREHLKIRFVTGDKKGFAITNRRIAEDMDYPLDLVSTIRRIDWIEERYEPRSVIYIGKVYSIITSTLDTALPWKTKLHRNNFFS